ncbi:Cadmium, cobalt and zinc/H(+)-K(+) antiporter [compost metagenome]
MHDLHIWTITSGMNALSGHLLVSDHIDHQKVLQQAIGIVDENFGIHHTTLQIEDSSLKHKDLPV